MPERRIEERWVVFDWAMGALARGITMAVAVLFSAAFIPTLAGAATAYPNVAYDLDGSPAPNPPSLNSLDLYVPDGASASDSRPVVIYVHGGGWRAGDKTNQIADKGNLFTGAGYIFASVNYRLSPSSIDGTFPSNRIRFPDHPADVGESIAWIDRNVGDYGGDPSRILLIGHSAGAQLVSLVSTDPSYVEAYGVDSRHLIGTVPLDTDTWDVAERVAAGTVQTKALMYNAFATPAENDLDDAWALGSPLNFADPADTDHLIVTQAAIPGRVNNGRRMAAALGQDPATSVFLAPYNHGGINDAVGGPGDDSGETEAIMDFFARMVAATETSKVKIKARPERPVMTRRGKRAKIRFRFEAATPAASYECRLDSKSFKLCSSPKKYAKVGVGRHTFRVRAIASNGDSGPTRKIGFRVIRRR